MEYGLAIIIHKSEALPVEDLPHFQHPISHIMKRDEIRKLTSLASCGG